MPSIPLDRTEAAILAFVGLLVFGALGASVAPTVRYHLRPAEDSAAVAAADRASAAVADAPAYRVALDGRATATRGDERATAAFDGEFRVNATTRRMTARATVLDDGPFGDETDRLHVDGYTAYRPCSRLSFGPARDVFYAVDLPRNRSWRSYTFLGGLVAAFDAAKLYDEGVETVGGRQAREVRVVLNPSRTDELAARTAPFEDDAGDDQISPLTAPEATDMRVWISTASGRPLRLRVSVERSQLLGPDVTAQFTYDVAYGPTTAPLPNRTVASEDACPS
ncbi:MAG: hypothetical protein V5A31_03430 [Haloferacaceae archaeon]